MCVLGVAWLGTTLINHYLDDIQNLAGGVLESSPWLLAVVLFFGAALLYSQAATTKALMPAALALGVNPVTAVAAFPAVSALFILPTYPTLLAAVEMDDTGTTRIGKAVFNHPFLIPGVVSIASSVLLGYLFGSVILYYSVPAASSFCGRPGFRYSGRRGFSRSEPSGACAGSAPASSCLFCSSTKITRER